MKIVIDIPEKIYNSFMNDWANSPDILHAVRRGTPLSKEQIEIQDILLQFLVDGESDICCDELAENEEEWEICGETCHNHTKECWIRWARLKIRESENNEQHRSTDIHRTDNSHRKRLRGSTAGRIRERIPQGDREEEGI